MITAIGWRMAEMRISMRSFISGQLVRSKQAKPPVHY
jgi:hypothetical protein